MKIMFVGRNAQIGGGSTFRLNIGRGLIARGHQVAVSAFGGPMVRRYRDAGIRYHWVPPFPQCAGLLARAIRAEGVDVVHASNTTAGDVALLACRRTGVPLVVSLHNTIADHESRHPCLKEARRILVFDEGAADSASHFHEEFDTSRIQRVPRPVEHRPVDPEGISPLNVAYVARLSSRKGKVALSLVEAFREYSRQTPGARLTILGDGSMRRAVAQRAAEVTAEGHGRISLVGPVLDPAPVLASAGVVVGAGYAALEAVMQGRAVIGAGFHGYGVVAEDCLPAAIQCNFGDTVGRWEMSPENFLQALRELRTAWEDPQSRPRYWGLDRAAAPVHSAARVAERLERVYQEVLAQ